MALSIYYQSPKAYNLLSKLFALPAKRTIQCSLENTNVKPGFNDAVFHALQIKCNTMDDKDKCVALIFDEMSLKSSLVYNHGLDKIEGFEDFDELGTSQYPVDNCASGKQYFEIQICHRVVLLHSTNLSGSRDTRTENVSHTLVLPS